MQFKLGKHITPADMMREAGERAARKSQRRNMERELKNLGKSSDEKRKKLEGRGGYSYKDIHKTPLRKLVAEAHKKKKYDPEEEDAKGMARWESWAEDHPEEAERMEREGR